MGFEIIIIYYGLKGLGSQTIFWPRRRQKSTTYLYTDNLVRTSQRVVWFPSHRYVLQLSLTSYMRRSSNRSCSGSQQITWHQSPCDNPVVLGRSQLRKPEIDLDVLVPLTVSPKQVPHFPHPGAKVVGTDTSHEVTAEENDPPTSGISH